jgi:short-subunit dehydrogenase
MSSLSARNVLITGASSGIGKALSEAFAQEGSHLFLGCHPAESAALSAWAEELKHRYGIRVYTYPVDLAAESGPEKLYEEIIRTGEIIHVLVNNAGLMAYGDFHRLSRDRQEMLIKVNIIAYFRLTHLFVGDMVKRGDGRILNVSSVSAFQPSVHQAVYGATKAFIQNFSEAVNQELKGTGVSVCTLNPSYTDTPLLKGEDFPAHLRWYLICGLSSPEDIARKGLRAFLKGKTVYIPGLRNWFIHDVLLRFVPRGLANQISAWVLKGKGNK